MPVPLRANANLKAEAKYNVVTEFPNFDLHSAAASGNQGLVEYALTRGQPVNSVLDGVLPLHAASAGGHERVVKLLIDHGADVNAPRLPRRKNRDASAPIVGSTGSTPLHFAAANGNKTVITALLLRGAHADRRDKHGITPAMLAEQHGWLECAEVLNNWVKDKDRDLRERGQPEDGTSIAPTYGAQASPGNEDDTKSSTRKHIQVKRSIDTALNIFKSGSTSTPPSKLAISSTSSATNLPASSTPISPTRSRRDLSPSSSEDGRLSPSPSPIDPGSRRPSLPHIFQPPSSPASRSHQKPAILTKRSSRRPRSAGTDAEQEPDTENISAALSRGAPGRKLGTKYSLLNLFKKGSESGSGGVPLERTTSHQTTSSMSIPMLASPSQTSSLKLPTMLSSSPKQAAFVSPSGDNGPLPAAGYRFGSNDSPVKARTNSSSHTRASPSTSYTPPRPQVPFAVDLHNALAAQQHQLPHRDRSGSSSSTTRHEPSMGLGISFDEGDNESGTSSVSTSPLNRVPVRRFMPSEAGHSRDRSGSTTSNRNVAIYDDEVIIASGSNGSSGDVSFVEGVNGKGKTSSRPGILRGHNRTSSSGQPRALRFDSSASVLSGLGIVARRESDAQPPKPTTIPLRGCISAGSLNRLQYERNGSPRLRSVPLNGAEQSWKVQRPERVPDSAPPNIGDFDRSLTEEDSEYGRPIDKPRSTQPHLDVQTRNRGLSFTSSESSLSPALSAGDDETVSSTLLADFPFSINAPPPPLDDSANISAVQLQVSPPPVSPISDARMRGDSVSSTSTTDSRFNPSLSASGTTSGSNGSVAVSTPMVSPEGGSYLNLPGMDMTRLSQRDKANVANVSELQADEFADAQTQGIPVVGLHERRGKSPLDLDVKLVASHAQAEALVQRTQQDILSAHADGQAGATPLSARLAALGESLELERRLREREQRRTEELRSRSVGAMSELTEDTTSTEVPGRASCDPQCQTPGPPHSISSISDDAEGTSRTAAFERTKPTHHPSLSASAVETASPAFDSDIESPAIQSKFFDRRTARSRTPDPDNDLSRISSLEALDVTDTELGPALFRVSTAPNSVTSRDKRERTFASNTKLTRMGFSPNESGRSPPPKRFGGLKSLMQSLKGKP